MRFERCSRDDFPLIGEWFREPLVARWWCHDPSPGAIEADFGAVIDGREPGDLLVVFEDGTPIGLIQRYLIGDYPDYERDVSAVWPVPAGALSFDYLIGTASLRGRGRGARMIAELAALSWADHPEANDVVVPVHAANRASWRSLENAGFELVARGELEPDNPIDTPEHVVYRLRRPR